MDFSSVKKVNNALLEKKFNVRHSDCFSVGMSRKQIEEYRKSQNPLRENIPITQYDLFCDEIRTKLTSMRAHVNAYNEKMEDIARTIENNKESLKISDSSRIEIRVKIIDGTTRYVHQSYLYPNQLLKNKNLKQYLSFVAISTGSKEKEIISIPLMIGSKWCATWGKTPMELHNAGENAAPLCGYFIIESQKSVEAKFLLAHKKVCHNSIVTVYDDKNRKAVLTTLKTQDSKNNSNEANVYKKNNVFYFDTPDFVITYKVTKIFKQIYLLMKALGEKDGSLAFMDRYDEFMEKIILIAGGQVVKKLLMFDYTENDEMPIKLPEKAYDIKSALKLLFKNDDRMNLYANTNIDHVDIHHFPNILINSIFPSIYVPEMKKERNSGIKREFNILQAKATLLIKMVIMNDLTERKLLKFTDRDDLSFKTFLTPAEYFVMEITRDGCKLINELENKIYRPNNKGKSDANVFETLTFANNFEDISKITSTLINRSKFSKNADIRGIHYSQVGYECIYETPSGANIGLVLHSTTMCMFSTSKNYNDFLEYLMNILEGNMGYSSANLFKEETKTAVEIGIIQYLENIDMDINQVLVNYHHDMDVYMKACSIIEQNMDFILSTYRKFLILFSLYNAVKNMDFLNADLFDNLDKIAHLYDTDALKESVSIDEWKEFLKFHQKITDEGIPFEVVIPSIDHKDINKRLGFWRFVDSLDIGETENIDYVIDIEKRKRKPISLNSVPFALIDHYSYEELRKILKRDYRFMDVIVIEEFYEMTVDGYSIKQVASYNILCDGGRACRPLFRCDVLREKELMTRDALTDYFSKKTRFEDVIAEGVIEIVFPNEFAYYHISQSIEEIEDQRYCEIDPCAIFNVPTASAPLVNTNPGNRAIHESAMSKAALSEISTNVGMLSMTSAKILHGPNVPIFTTKVAEYYTGFLRNGVNICMAIKVDSGNVEDAYVVSKKFAKKIVIERVSTYDITIASEETIGFAPAVTYKKDRYHAIDPLSGLPILGASLKVGDCIFAKYIAEKIVMEDDEGRPITDVQIVNKSVFVEEGKDGYVHSIFKVPNDKTMTFRITVASIKNLEVGDKLATRYAQKGVVGMIDPDLPICSSGPMTGMVPDAIYSPLSFTSRCTPGPVMELLISTYAVVTGKQIDASPYGSVYEMLEYINDELVKRGFKPWLEEEFYDPKTGSTYTMSVGMIHVRVLRQTANEKQKACGFIDHTIDKGTKQPSKGGPTGAIRMSYMDSNTFASHGTPSLIHAMFCEQTDKIVLPICECGHICDRYNNDPHSVTDINVSTRCTSCGKEGSIFQTKLPYAALKARNEFVRIGVNMKLFPIPAEQ